MGAAERSATDRKLFPRRARLGRHEDFARVFAENARASDERFTVLARGNDLGHPRLGLAISRKAVGRAAERNRLKRLVREHFRHAQHAMPAIDLVVLARPGSGRAPAAALRLSLENLWTRVIARCKS